MQYMIRKATIADAQGIAEVHVQSWLETYKGIMPQSKLDSLSVSRSSQNWVLNINRGEIVYLAEVDNEIVGFTVGGKNRENNNCETGEANKCDCEMSCLYLIKKYQGYGIGRDLFLTLTRIFSDLGYISMAIWVAEANNTRNFYSKMGAYEIDRRLLSIAKKDIPVIALSYSIRKN